MRTKTVGTLRPRSGDYKPNALEWLNETDSVKLCQWLLSGKLSYRQIRQKLRDELNVSVQITAISKYFQRYVLPKMIEMRSRAVDVAGAYSFQAKKNPAEFSSVAMDALECRAMEAILNRDLPAKELKTFLDLLLRWQEQRLKGQSNDLKLRRLLFLERRQRKIEAVLKSPLPSAEVAERCRLIFRQNGAEPPGDPKQLQAGEEIPD